MDGSRIVQEPDIHEAFDDGESALRVELAAAFWQAAKTGRIRLLDHGEGCVQFLHLRLQDYLASEYLWYEGDCQALRCVSGAGYVGQAADDARFAGARSLLVNLLRDGAARPRTPDSDEAWYLLCSAAMSNSAEGARCALQLSHTPDAAWEVLGRSVFVPIRPRLGAAAVLVRAMRWSDMLRHQATYQALLFSFLASNPLPESISCSFLSWKQGDLRTAELVRHYRQRCNGSGSCRHAELVRALSPDPLAHLKAADNFESLWGLGPDVHLFLKLSWAVGSPRRYLLPLKRVA